MTRSRAGRLRRTPPMPGRLAALLCVMGLCIGASVVTGCEGSPGRIPDHDTAVDPGAAQHGYRVVSLGSLGGGETAPNALNNQGQVAGVSRTWGGEHHAFLWTSGHMLDLGTLGGTFSNVSAINDAGLIVGRSKDTAGHMVPCIWRNGRIRGLGTLGGTFGSADAVNSRGDVVGEATDTNERAHAVLWSGGQIHDLGTLGGRYSSAVAINDSGEMAGVATAAPHRPGGHMHAFMWQRGHMTALNPPHGVAAAVERSGATCIDALGRVAGYYSIDGQDRACLWVNGIARDLGTLGGGASWSEAVNASAGVCGGSFSRTGAMHACVWQNGRLRDLGTTSGYPDSLAYALNSSGVVVGDIGRHDEGYSPWLVQGHAVVWKSGRMEDLQAGVLAHEGLTSSLAEKINERGQILVSGFEGEKESGFLLIPPSLAKTLGAPQL